MKCELTNAICKQYYKRRKRKLGGWWHLYELPASWQAGVRHASCLPLGDDHARRRRPAIHHGHRHFIVSQSGCDYRQEPNSSAMSCQCYMSSNVAPVRLSKQQLQLHSLNWQHLMLLVTAWRLSNLISAMARNAWAISL